ncbi:uncharacterized protein LOC127720372 [Mytilus californianus]|uniref:uncharacterized protein LOC127720372 n=1 Tax=Mytilus californianus TaxID=6549 RepID=UPI00224710E1|nr:uncharacterized protein LOC127720372 [Mytilus californianus]
MATKYPTCDICLNLHVTKSASVWCSECEEAICKDCEPRHRTQKATKNHKTIAIENYQELPLYIADIKLECEDHSQKLDFYCSVHSEPCCTRCISENHKDCRELKPLPEVVDGVKSSAAFVDLEDRVKDLSQVISQIIQEKLDNKSNLKGQRKTIINEVERVRKTINTHLDTIQDALLNTLGANERRQGDGIDRLVEKLGKMKANVDEIANGLEKTKNHASNFQTFLGVNKWIREIENQEREVRSAQSDQSMANVGIQIEMNPLLDTLETDISEFGKLEVIFLQPPKLVLWKEQQGQALFFPSSQFIRRIKLSTNRSFDIPKGESECTITGCVMFEDGRIVFCDCNEVNKRLIVMNEDCSLNKEIKFEDRPLDLTIVDPNTVAFTVLEKKLIIMVDVNTSKIKQTILLNGNCYGICCIEEKLVVCVSGKKILIVDLSGNVLSTVLQTNAATYCSVMNDKIYYAAHSHDVVYCSDLNGSAKWKFNCETLDYPFGITNAAYGDIFVTCRNANKVIVIESDGNESRLLLTREDGLQHPRAIHYNHKRDMLLVCNESGQCFMYKITN